ncbi:ABC transporter ATP-binding protein [Iamia sp.]|uniref:ABC transporter ATP-binding protein n=1 Tax=Iamia sp. TaxID=2722710 RepID=UPI002C9118F1|nr:ABC transporter ATP-binding protein [Iamia sp.]HXH59663.1 ABC transporter ATP-binding protein [Iamia sp.]
MTAVDTEPATPGTDAEHLLVVDDLSTSFATGQGPLRAVEHVSLDLGRGRTLGIVGESGSGKSVLARSIMGLLPKYASRTGSVRFEGQEMIGASASDLRTLWGARMAMVFQDPMTALNPVLRIGRQITESINEHLDYSKTQQRETAVALLRSVGIPEPERRLRQYPHELSGGMRQRVVIAISLACGPALLFADEPTTALDVTVQAQILDLLEAQQRERNMAVVLVTHDLGVVATRADEIAVMYGGRIVEQAPTQVLFREMRHPYTEALLKSIPRLDLPSHTRLEAIAGRPPDLLDPPSGCRFTPRCPYAQDKCHAEEPPLEDDGTGHLYRCWFPVGITSKQTTVDSVVTEANVRQGDDDQAVPAKVPPAPPVDGPPPAAPAGEDT